MATPLIDSRDLTRTYMLGETVVHALGGVSLTVERGEFVAIVGASGSGKSTLMAILGCLDRPTSGQYRLYGQDVFALDDAELAHIRNRQLGFVFQSFNLLPISALENVALPLEYSDDDLMNHARCIADARAELALMGLAGLERRKPAQMSGGQQQRVAIARALIHDPILVLADEPTGNLDSATSHAIMDTLRASNREKGVTVLVVTHDAGVAAYADRTITMCDGKILKDHRQASLV